MEIRSSGQISELKTLTWGPFYPELGSVLYSVTVLLLDANCTC
jgi:hypothetical protein